MAGVVGVYRGLWRVAWPLARWWVVRKDTRRCVDLVTISERFGEYARRPAMARDGRPTVWIHGASVGECLSALPLIDYYRSDQCARAGHKRPRVLVSTSTPTARAVMLQRLNHYPEDQVHCVLAPLDHPACVGRFFDHWHPTVGIWIESELWPNLILEASRRGTRIALMNARMSPRSFHRWQWPFAYSLIRSVLPKFTFVACQTNAIVERFTALGARNVEQLLNLKLATRSTSVIADTDVANFRDAIGSRRCWAAVSTHDGEEALMARVHAELAHSHQLLTIIVPRHTNRTDAIIEELYRVNPSLVVCRRSVDRVPAANCNIFICDTMVGAGCGNDPHKRPIRAHDVVCQGETELIFQSVGLVVMGGSFGHRGGHNPIEPLRAGCQVIVGPHMDNFDDIMNILEAKQRDMNITALRRVAAADELSAHVTQALSFGSCYASTTTTEMVERLAAQALAQYQQKAQQLLLQ
ncbi:TPA: hypothetical protein N0F65_000841 [Lagenidium giganteum]|uniref:3-deoxy-D-manno-octulosonic-acid transferase N-terminal domain-containing protein n=1 Tax=Lagenidium giganteum TaxID=4803 RepID=A0AAV2YZF3_9STRA|nr:TPA: hypothetical protein N0F65_000841 [Lagenidium giganteum]